ncbi:cysteine--tRNA ligase [Candidatus Woesearchaeota archaeon]|nr:cysteine--tRNA ligase [Candidatus Woesearchaeota archaeon]
MSLSFYNTLTRNKEPFHEMKKGEVRIYTCGPTVYNYAHIGNWRSFIFSDLLRRYLKYKGYDVVHVMNLTDVDDKTIRDSKKEGISLKKFTERYTKYFFDDMDALNIERVEYYPKATESINEMIAITKRLLDKGIAYKTEDGIYYDVSKFNGYGKLSKIKFEGLKAGVRVKKDEYEKESANDFALWKAYDKADGDVFWETELGKGRPGWHIECSAMSMKFLGQSFDIHTGGIDLIFPHHENEIAQSEGYSEKPFVKYWLHAEHLLVNGEKMSKSKGNFFILKDVLGKGYSPKAVRYELMATHYRQKLNFTFEALDASENAIKRFREFLIKLKAVKGKEDNPKIDSMIKDAKDEFEAAMDDDLNISGGLAAVFNFMSEINKAEISRKDALKAFNLMMEFDKVLGILEFKDEKVPKEIMDLVKRRDQARKDKDWVLADKLRDAIKDNGYVVDDTAEGSFVKKN